MQGDVWGLVQSYTAQCGGAVQQGRLHRVPVILCMGVVVAGLVMAVMLPLLDISGS